MKKSLLLALSLLTALPLAAEDSEKLNRRYLKLKDSADYYLGEGVAQLKEFENDGLKALARARGAKRSSRSSRCRSTIRSGSSTRRARPACRRRSCLTS